MRPGTVTSPAFTVNANYLDVLIAGGNHPLPAGAYPPELGRPQSPVVNGQVVATVTGNNSVSLNWQAIDVSAYAGQQAQLEVIDQSDGGLGPRHLRQPVLLRRQGRRPARTSRPGRT